MRPRREICTNDCIRTSDRQLPHTAPTHAYHAHLHMQHASRMPTSKEQCPKHTDPTLPRHSHSHAARTHSIHTPPIHTLYAHICMHRPYTTPIHALPAVHTSNAHANIYFPSICSPRKHQTKITMQVVVLVDLHRFSSTFLKQRKLHPASSSVQSTIPGWHEHLKIHYIEIHDGNITFGIPLSCHMSQGAS